MDLTNVCRCCLTDGCYKDISNEYFYGGQNEIYSKMLLDTFNLTISQQIQLKQLICEDCITKLRDANNFRKMVVDTENTLLQMLNASEGVDAEPALKQENSEYGDDFDDTLDDHFNNDFSWDVGDNTLNDEDKGQIFVIKLEPKDEPETVLKKKPTKILKKSAVSKKVENKLKTKQNTNGSKNVKKSTCTTAKSRRNREKAVIPQSQIASRENSLKLILNSNLCLFKSLKTKFRCFHCPESYLSMQDLREHSKTHSNNRTLQLRINCLRGMTYRNVDISSLACKLCQESCINLDILKSHLTEKHSIQFGNGDHFLIPYNLENDFKCVLCEETFNTFTRLSIHMNSHYMNNVCEICGVSYINRLSLRMHVNSVHKEKKCSLCSATFISHYLRVKHMRKVHNTASSKRYCMLCNKTFRYSYLLEEHRIQEHGAKRQISTCPECGKTFLSPQNLKIHIRCVHVKERNHPCGICGMRFFTKCDQKRHERTHEDVRSFACGYCEGRFKAKDSWRRHLRRQHAHLFDTQ
ncbi:PR domain zinc finger protein 5-like isoform X1 [Ostrinia furnacalis]|uniref:PR domain zinc finger protein 5-like isoform X1 n=1 Tax=Ostrinia furnacalis TaxID=93504 RepID=UPI00103B3EF2|nr:PR domain zinc finger protein 5-like isoform X1 [Ostrinia furnacalis]